MTNTNKEIEASKRVKLRRAVADTHAFVGTNTGRVLSFLRDAGLLDTTFARPCLTRSDLADLMSRSRLFVGRNPGGHDIGVGRLHDAIRAHPWLQPARSGHLGNWGPIWSGQAPLLAYNRAVTVDLTVAQPVIHSVALTENAELTDGDTIYRPGAQWRDGVLRPLELLSPVGAAGWQALDRSTARFAPWAWARQGHDLTHLPALHRKALREQAPVPVLIDAELLWNSAGVVRTWLTRLFDHVALTAPAGDITWLFGRAVLSDASVAPLLVRYRAGAFELSVDGGTSWSGVGGAARLADQCLLPYQVVSEPNNAEQILRAAPAVTPLLSNRLAKAILGYLGAATTQDDAGIDDPFALFVEWGALSQGGYPPMRQGYFAGKGNMQMTRWTVTALATANDLPGLMYLMLPLTAAILMPSTARPSDAAALAPWLRDLKAATDGWGDNTELSLRRAAETMARWDRQDEVSDFYRSKFSGARSVQPHDPGTNPARTIELPEISALTMRQTSLAVATLFGAWRVDR